MSGWIYYVGVAFQAAVLFYFWADNDYYWRRFVVAIAVVATALVWLGIYPEIWPRGRGFFTPNRVCGWLGYVLVFACTALVSAYKREAKTAQDCWERLRARL